jgi:hypothetical protein
MLLVALARAEWTERQVTRLGLPPSPGCNRSITMLWVIGQSHGVCVVDGLAKYRIRVNATAK